MKNTFLFVCTANMLRSPTAEHVARKMGYSADSAGTDKEFAVRHLTKDQLRKAEYVICMEEEHRQYIYWTHPEMKASERVHVFSIADIYAYCQPALVEILESRINGFVGSILPPSARLIGTRWEYAAPDNERW